MTLRANMQSGPPRREDSAAKLNRALISAWLEIVEQDGEEPTLEGIEAVKKQREEVVPRAT
eukprot:CAMPEP_0202853690 /NCGR_PEP_ID=MMETSP1389-20130828/90608_1 /ASSEMBLY_ACC=CAM_ASM_000865 /TAXON_ID=302021 /ORGANISM="Rhodomonas sp., Strain CCMP768" /LENGTH=60 /DNA_ID=CAMNT_0049532243 /DNA_START=12 /DNA_END=194 /DNA_ORIENTATION=+